MNLKQLLYGISTFLPGLSQFHSKGTGGTISARYCYSVWLRHLVLAWENNLIRDLPNNVGELGPGDSIGIGLAALLSGVKTYYGLDAVEHSTFENNAIVFEELVNLFEAREAIPNNLEFRNLKPTLSSYDFPHHILTEQLLEESLSPKRLQKIKDSIKNPLNPNSIIFYRAPWERSDLLEKESLDMIFSQAVLEHVENLNETYASMYKWLVKDGFISHQIDFKSHGLTSEWNGHWFISDLLWKILKGKRPYLLNRQPHSVHIKLLKENNFKIICDLTVELNSKLKKKDLPETFNFFSENDLVISGTFIQAEKKCAV